MCSRLGGASSWLTVRVAPPAQREGHPTYECHPSRVHMHTRGHVATEKGIIEAIFASAIVGTFAYLLPTH